MEYYIPEKTDPFPDSLHRIFIEPDGQEMIRIHREFVKSIEKDASPPVTGEDGYIALEMALGAYCSAEKGKVVSFPLEE